MIQLHYAPTHRFRSHSALECPAPSSLLAIPFCQCSSGVGTSQSTATSEYSAATDQGTIAKSTTGNVAGGASTIVSGSHILAPGAVDVGGSLHTGLEAGAGSNVTINAATGVEALSQNFAQALTALSDNNSRTLQAALTAQSATHPGTNEGGQPSYTGLGAALAAHPVFEWLAGLLGLGGLLALLFWLLKK